MPAIFCEQKSSKRRQTNDRLFEPSGIGQLKFVRIFGIVILLIFLATSPRSFTSPIYFCLKD